MWLKHLCEVSAGPGVCAQIFVHLTLPLSDWVGGAGRGLSSPKSSS